MYKSKLSWILLTATLSHFLYAQQSSTPREKALIIEKYKKATNTDSFSKLELAVIYNYLKSKDNKASDDAFWTENKRLFSQEEMDIRQEKKNRLSLKGASLNLPPFPSLKTQIFRESLKKYKEFLFVTHIH